jgi:hypothetical protein
MWISDAGLLDSEYDEKEERCVEICVILLLLLLSLLLFIIVITASTTSPDLSYFSFGGDRLQRIEKRKMLMELKKEREAKELKELLEIEKRVKVEV